MPAVAEVGTAIVRQFLVFLTGRANPSLVRAASELTTSWCQPSRRAERVLNAILILTLDHEI
ncbi:MAG: hypothetical protein QOH78_693, partial [Verrucomicrobiota bacterium]